MEEAQLRLGDDGELIEIVPNLRGKGKRKNAVSHRRYYQPDLVAWLSLASP